MFDVAVMMFADADGGVTKMPMGVCECQRVYGIVEDAAFREYFLQTSEKGYAMFVWGPNWVRCPHCQARIELPPKEQWRRQKDARWARMAGLAETAVSVLGLSNVIVVYGVDVGLLPMPDAVTLILRDTSGRVVTIPNAQVDGMTDDEIFAAICEAWGTGKGVETSG